MGILNSGAKDIEFITITLDDIEDEIVEEEEIQEQVVSESEPKVKRKIWITYLSYLSVIVISFILALLITQYVIINAHIPSESMEPTVQVDDRLIGYRLAYLFSEPERDDIIIFYHQCYEYKEKEMLIKRVIGVAGDTIFIQDGVLYINQVAIEEPYIKETMVGDYGPYEVPDGTVFVMGDNRNISDDARFWDYPFVPLDQVLAKAELRYWPSLQLFY